MAARTTRTIPTSKILNEDEWEELANIAAEGKADSGRTEDPLHSVGNVVAMAEWLRSEANDIPEWGWNPIHDERDGELVEVVSEPGFVDAWKAYHDAHEAAEDQIKSASRIAPEQKVRLRKKLLELRSLIGYLNRDKGHTAYWKPRKSHGVRHHTATSLRFPLEQWQAAMEALDSARVDVLLEIESGVGEASHAGNPQKGFSSMATPDDIRTLRKIHQLAWELERWSQGSKTAGDSSLNTEDRDFIQRIAEDVNNTCIDALAVFSRHRNSIDAMYQGKHGVSRTVEIERKLAEVSHAARVWHQNANTPNHHRWPIRHSLEQAVRYIDEVAISARDLATRLEADMLAAQQQPESLAKPEAPRQQQFPVVTETKPRGGQPSGVIVEKEPQKEEWWPYGAFPPDVQGRLVRAAKPERKTRRVRSKDEDGTKLYSVDDARRNWPQDMK